MLSDDQGICAWCQLPPKVLMEGIGTFCYKGYQNPCFDERNYYYAVAVARFILCIFLLFTFSDDRITYRILMTHFSYMPHEGERSHVVSIAQLWPGWLDLSVSRHRGGGGGGSGGGTTACWLILDGKKKQLDGSLTTHDDHYFAIALLARKRSVNFKMSFWFFQISKKTNEIFFRISSLVSKKRSNQKSSVRELK